jgi:hypothetical protein
MLRRYKHTAALVLGCALLVAVVFSTSTEAAEPQPSLTSVSIDSDNAVSIGTDEIAKVGDTVTLSFTASKPIQTPTVAFTVGGVPATGPVTVANATGNDWSSIAVGELHTVALKSDGTLWAWGEDRYGYGLLGDGTTGFGKSTPTQIGSATEWTAAFTLASGDTEGAVAFTIDFSDTASNAGGQVTSTTDGTSVALVPVPSGSTRAFGRSLSQPTPAPGCRERRPDVQGTLGVGPARLEAEHLRAALKHLDSGPHAAPSRS